MGLIDTLDLVQNNVQILSVEIFIGSNFQTVLNKIKLMSYVAYICKEQEKRYLITNLVGICSFSDTDT